MESFTKFETFCILSINFVLSCSNEEKQPTKIIEPKYFKNGNLKTEFHNNGEIKSDYWENGQIKESLVKVEN